MGIEPGETFIIDPNGAGNNHLWVVLHVYATELDGLLYAVIANVTSTGSGRWVDRACILSPNDEDSHPFVKHESYILYGAMMEIEASALASLPANCRREPVSAGLLSRIRQGAHTSKHTKKRFKKLVPR